MQLTHLLSLMATILLGAAKANPVPDSAGFSQSDPTPTRKFTLAAFESPWPAGSTNPASHNITGLAVEAKDGSFYLNPADKNPPTAVFWVDEIGQTFLQGNPPQQLYLDTQSGALKSQSPGLPFTNGAYITNFVHLGQGTTVTVPIAGEPGYANAGGGTFQWLGAPNDSWFFCPTSDNSGLLQILKIVGGGSQNFNSCFGYALIALDYTG
ncbi:hypothetical protein G7Y89_g917 [Cudoniella acicularis]|uniref:Uncharacterized protein n=1 Tax=Cudoniella acicularis TaxID=354080 RepID=A0A8H4RXY2_9HELO|nr:hypothetical protein G7Y89_g917 [Cudoniella acicularis]